MRKPPSRRSRSHTCCFSTPFIREQVDPRVKRAWEARFGSAAPFGNLRASFRECHCAVLNPYSSTFCPYPADDCAMAFLQCVLATTERSRNRQTAVGYFRSVAVSLAAQRADSKPLARESDEARRLATKASQGPGNTAGKTDGVPSGPGASEHQDQDGEPVRSRISTPEHIGSVLGSFDLGPRPRPADDGKTSPVR